MGYVVVFEDLTDLLRAQKQTAWREVARRIAHEIKNPLTPHRAFGGAHSPSSGARNAARRGFARTSSASAPRPSAHRWKRCAPWWMSSPPWPASRRHVRSRPTSTASSTRRWLMFDGRLDGHLECSRFLARRLAAGAGRSRRHEARHRQPGRQRRRSHAGLAGEGNPHLHHAASASATRSRS